MELDGHITITLKKTCLTREFLFNGILWSSSGFNGVQRNFMGDEAWNYCITEHNWKSVSLPSDSLIVKHGWEITQN